MQVTKATTFLVLRQIVRFAANLQPGLQPICNLTKVEMISVNLALSPACLVSSLMRKRILPQSLLRARNGNNLLVVALDCGFLVHCAKLLAGPFH